jgi:hypothetical protein
MVRGVSASGAVALLALVLLLPFSANAHGDYTDMAASIYGVFTAGPCAIVSFIFMIISIVKLSARPQRSQRSYATGVIAVTSMLLAVCATTAVYVLYEWSQTGIVAVLWSPAVLLASASIVLAICLLRRERRNSVP